MMRWSQSFTSKGYQVYEEVSRHLSFCHFGFIFDIDNIEKGEVLFNYYLFNSTDYFNESICFIETPVYHSVTEQFNEQYSVTQKEFDYYSVVIADFVNETQDILVGYNIYNVKYKMSMLWLWLSIIFIFILLFFGYTTFTLYRQIKITDKRLLFNEKLKN